MARARALAGANPGRPPPAAARLARPDRLVLPRRYEFGDDAQTSPCHASTCRGRVCWRDKTCCSSLRAGASNPSLHCVEGSRFSS